jgi:hypothetical protein
MHVKRTLGWISAIAFACAVLFVIYERVPPYTFDPFCTYDLTYRLNVTIEAEGQQYSSEVVHQLSRSRRWIREMNSAGCQQTHGTALSFRLANNRLVLISSWICPKAKEAFDDTPYGYKYPGSFAQAMREHRRVDLTSLCVSVHRDRPPSVFSYFGYDGFVIDDADNPARWKGFKLDLASSNSDEHLRIVSAFAEAADDLPKDELDNVAPTVLKTTFKYDDWWNSPEAILSFSRRYYPDRKFTYTADQS